MSRMTHKEVKELVAKAKEKDIKAYMDLREIYATTDMPYHEFVSHVKIIAEGKE